MINDNDKPIIINDYYLPIMILPIITNNNNDKPVTLFLFHSVFQVLLTDCVPLIIINNLRRFILINTEKECAEQAMK